MNKKLYIQETINWISQNDFDFLITLHFTEEVGRAKTEKVMTTLFIYTSYARTPLRGEIEAILKTPYISEN